MFIHFIIIHHSIVFIVRHRTYFWIFLFLLYLYNHLHFMIICYNSLKVIHRKSGTSENIGTSWQVRYVCWTCKTYIFAIYTNYFLEGNILHFFISKSCFLSVRLYVRVSVCLFTLWTSQFWWHLKKSISSFHFCMAWWLKHCF